VQSGAGATPLISAEQLVAEMPQLEELAAVDAETFSTMPSPHVSLDDVLALSRHIEQYVAGHDVTGIVVTHGTDTLEEVAYALDLLWRHPFPLVITGAMRNRSLPGSDGPANLLAAAVVAVSPTARNLGVLVVFNDQIHAARYVRKMHTASVATFQSPTVGPLGYMAEGAARVALAPSRRDPVVPTPEKASDVPVALLKMSIGDDGRMLPYVTDAGYRGIVIEGFGGGHVTRQIAESPDLERLVESMPVVLSSRAGAGEPLRATYAGFPGSEIDLLGRGLISSGALDGPKSRVLLTLLLAGGAHRDAIKEAFALHGQYGDEQ
jgi:L-asparaginase